MAPQIPPEEDPASIGNILVGMGLLNKEELAELVAEFTSQRDQMLGAFLMQKIDGIREEHIEIALAEQKRMRGELDDKTISRVITISRKSSQRLMEQVDKLLATTSLIVMK